MSIGHPCRKLEDFYHGISDLNLVYIALPQIWPIDLACVECSANFTRNLIDSRWWRSNFGNWVELNCCCFEFRLPSEDSTRFHVLYLERENKLNIRRVHLEKWHRNQFVILSCHGNIILFVIHNIIFL